VERILLHLFIKKGYKAVVITEEYHCYELHAKFYPNNLLYQKVSKKVTFFTKLSSCKEVHFHMKLSVRDLGSKITFFIKPSARKAVSVPSLPQESLFLYQDLTQTPKNITFFLIAQCRKYHPAWLSIEAYFFAKVIQSNFFSKSVVYSISASQDFNLVGIQKSSVHRSSSPVHPIRTVFI